MAVLNAAAGTPTPSGRPLREVQAAATFPRQTPTISGCGNVRASSSTEAGLCHYEGCPALTTSGRSAGSINNPCTGRDLSTVNHSDVRLRIENRTVEAVVDEVAVGITVQDLEAEKRAERCLVVLIEKRCVADNYRSRRINHIRPGIFHLDHIGDEGAG